MLIRNVAANAYYRGACRVLTVERETAEVLPVKGGAFHIHLQAVDLIQVRWHDIEPAELIEPFRARSNSILASRCINEAKTLGPEDAERAASLHSEALTYKPDSVEALQRRADVYYAMKRHREAEQDYSALLALPPDGTESWTEKKPFLLLTKRSKCRRELGNLEEAANDLSEALSIGPENIDTHQSLAGIHLALSEAHVGRARQLAAEWEEQTKSQGDKDQLGLF